MRLPDEHLDPHELTALLDGSAGTSVDGSGSNTEVEEHLAVCDECVTLLSTLRAVRNAAQTASQLLPSLANQDHPPVDVWLQWARGDVLENTEDLLEHASQCPQCAPELRRAMTLFAEGETEPVPQGLASATPEWQHSMGVKLAAMTRSDARSAAANKSQTAGSESTSLKGLLTFPLRRFSFVAYGAMAAGVMLAAGLALTGWWIHQHSESRLLVVAYNKQRLTELRIPGGDDVQVASFTRGDDSANEVPAELNDLSATVHRELEKDPQSGYWRQVRGRIHVLEANPTAALNDFNTASSEAKTPLVGLDGDLGDAWFEMGEQTGKAADYARAAELYSQQMQKDPVNLAVLEFNRGLCWERQGLRENALKDYKAALAAEKSPAWKHRIQAKIDALNSNSGRIKTDGYEAAVNELIEKLMPAADSGDTSARGRMDALSKLGAEKHQDTWPRDWIQGPSSSARAKADAQLSAAVSGLQAGHFDDILRASRTAIALYQGVSNRAGVLQARQFEVYALQRLGRNDECADKGASLLAESGIDRYPILRVETLLNASYCEIRLGHDALALAWEQQVQAIGAQDQLPQSSLRSISAQANMMSDNGMASEAWQRDAEALVACWRQSCSPRTKYAILYTMVQAAAQLGENHVATEVMHTGVDLLALSGTQVSRAYAVETLATVEGNAGDVTASAHDFQQAAEIAAGAGGKIPPIYPALWKVDQAEVLVRAGDAGTALRILNKIAPTLLTSDYGYGRIQFYDQLAITQLAAGAPDEAFADAQNAVRETEISLKDQHTNVEREQWARKNAMVYADLVNVDLKRGDANAALQVWERYRSNPYLERDHRIPTSVPSSAPDVLVLARLRGQYVGWVARPQPLASSRAIVLGDAVQVETQARMFYRLCSDRNSSLEDIRGVGGSLYRTLLAPLLAETKIGSGTSDHLWLDVDPSLGVVPFAALMTNDGAWLGERMQITELAPWWSLDPQTALHEDELHPEMRAVVIEGFDNAQGRMSEAGEVAKRFPGAKLLDARMTPPAAILHTLESAELFHYSGHAASGDKPALSLSGGAETKNNDALTPQSLGQLHMACRVAVLAACNTRSADPDQIERLPDLRNALLTAGAHTVVASSWDVDNASTRALMVAFYAQMQQHVTASRALEIAEQKIASNGEWQHPYFWAPFQAFTQ